ncbi:hypothetical protein PQX77_005598 [Marasmius sp. AFHP31]|nr:hypothetical protein PQX77_005598 [Marasmius sp. AFHP31]
MDGIDKTINAASPSSPNVQTLKQVGRDEDILMNCCDEHSRERLATRPRNLVVCIDGTSKKFGHKNSNVIELYSRLVKDDSQLTYYNSGIGTYPVPSFTSFSFYTRGAAHVFDMAFAGWLKKRIIEAYRWLSENYREGDRIFLFGFSRGAYQVRVLSAMIEKVGMIHRGNDYQIPFAYELYLKYTDDTQTELALCFKKTFSRDVKVHFVGAWDTVSSVGLIPSKPLPLTTTGMKHVCLFRHALALDERRVKFTPEHADGRIGAESSYPEAQHGLLPPKKEVWFAGTHSDIGGGTMENEQLTSNGPALRWMIRESTEAGLSFTPFSGERVKVYDKLKQPTFSYYLWMPLEILPGMNSSLVPHLGQRRRIPVGQLVHESVYTLDPKYSQKRLHEGLRDREGDHVERDKFDAIALNIEQCVKGEGDWKDLPDPDMASRLQGLASSKDGRLAFQDLYESLKTASASHSGERKTTLAKLNNTLAKRNATLAKRDATLAERTTVAKMKILCHVADQCQFPKHHHEDLPRVVSQLLGSSDTTTKNLAKDFLTKFSHDSRRRAAQSFKIYFDAFVNSLAISERGSFDPAEGKPYYLAVATAQTAVPIHDLTARRNLRTLRGHADHVQSVSFSPNSNDLLLVSGSLDNTIRAWDVASGSQWDAIKGHSGGTLSVSFSSDGHYVVSGGSDSLCKKWEVDRETRHFQDTPLPFKGHNNHVLSAAVSRDGSRLVSVSRDSGIHLWDCRTGSKIGGKLERKPNDPKQVIFLSDTHYFLSVSSHGMFRAGQSANGPFLSYKENLPLDVKLCSLGAYKNRLACGLSNGRIMVFTVKLELLDQGQLEIHKEHTHDYHLEEEGVTPALVTSVAFTDDLQRLVAGYADGYVVVWYAGGMKDVFHELSNGQGGPGVREIFHQPVLTHHPTADSLFNPGQAVTKSSKAKQKKTKNEDSHTH